MTPAKPVNLGTGSGTLFNNAPDEPLHASKIVLRVLSQLMKGPPAS